MDKFNKKCILLGVIICLSSVTPIRACAGNSTCNTTESVKPVTEKPKVESQPINDTKIGAASSDRLHVVDGLTAYAKFNPPPEGGFHPSPFLGIVGGAELPRPREVVGYGEAIPVPLHEMRPPPYMKHRARPIHPHRGYAAKPSLHLIPGNQLQDDIQYSSYNHYNPPEHLSQGEEKHHEIPGHDSDITVHSDISIEPEPTLHPDAPSHSSPIVNHHSDLSPRHPPYGGPPLKIPSYHLSEHYQHQIPNFLSTKPDFGSFHNSQSPISFPDDDKLEKETYPGQISYQLPHDIKPVEEEHHDDSLPSHVDAHPPMIKGHMTSPHDSFFHKISPWKGVLKLLATLVPLGFLVAALQPSVLIVNATEPPLRPIPIAPGVGGLITKFRAVGEDSVMFKDNGEACDKRQLCDALASTANSPYKLQLAHTLLAARLKGEQKRSLNEVVKQVAGGNCKYYNCPSLLAPPTPPT